ncbi:MAG: lipid-A-disaccharide synthase [Zetaproteobacteria bacterium]|nr:lipid-A-disaccharide synthase [Zetaproteobacteria bacterium]
MISPRIFISVGESSGDMHAAALMRELRADAMFQESTIEGISGPMMEHEGCICVESMQQLNVMGLGDVVRALPRILNIEKNIIAYLERHRPDLLILVDFPGFNMRLGKKARSLGIPVLHYIAPKLWAWGAWRVRKLRASQDRVAAILPFEPAWFASHGIEAEYVGNPSAVSCLSHDSWREEQLRERLGMSNHVPLLALLPGSRPSELARHIPLFVDLCHKIRSLHPEVQVVIPCAPGVDQLLFQPLVIAGGMLIDRSLPHYALRVDAAVAVSGTATLELALWDVPTVLVYQTSKLSMVLGRMLVQTKHIGLANIILDDTEVMPELLQEEASVDAIMHAIVPLLDRDHPNSVKQRQAFVELRHRLLDKSPAQHLPVLIKKMLCY